MTVDSSHHIIFKDVPTYLGGESQGEGLAGGLVVPVQVAEGGGQLCGVGHSRGNRVRSGPRGSVRS